MPVHILSFQVFDIQATDLCCLKFKHYKFMYVRFRFYFDRKFRNAVKEKLSEHNDYFRPLQDWYKVNMKSRTETEIL